METQWIKVIIFIIMIIINFILNFSFSSWSADSIRLDRVYSERARVQEEVSGHHSQDGPPEVERCHVQQDSGKDFW
jgi:hypothetical protein